MKKIEEIKNEFAKQLSYNSWSEFRMINNRNVISIEEAMNEVAKCYAKEVAIASLEKASNNLRQADGSFNSDFYSQKRSITNEENIVL